MKDNGGSAFPSTAVLDKEVADILFKARAAGASLSVFDVQRAACINPGMTLRDYFAGQVLNGLFACDNFNPRPERYGEVAEGCYEMADAMLAARNKQEGENE